MTKLKITLILLSCVLRVLTENRSSEAQPKIDNLLKPPPDKTVLQQQFPPIYTAPTEEPSFMSKVASWIFPFGGASEKPLDATPAETRYAPQYLPSSQNGYPKQPCNPCNREPWIPVAATHGRDTVIGFVQQSHGQNQAYIPVSNNGYQQQQSIGQNFQPPPLIPQQRYPQSLQYGPPVQQQYHASAAIQQQYGIPKDHYGVPTNNNPTFERPPENFKTPVQHFLPPPLSKHPIPLFKSSGLPSQKLHPLKQGFPPKHGALKPSSSKFRLNSPPQHGPPIPLHFGKPQLDKYKFSQSPSPTKAPLLNNNFNLPSANTHSGNIYASTRGNEGILLQPPPFNIDYFASPFNAGVLLNNHQLPSVLTQNYELPLPISSGNAEQNRLRYNYPNTNILQSNNGLNKPIPFPGLGPHQIPPLHNAQPFQTGFSSAAFNNLQLQQESKLKLQTHNKESVQSVQVIPSIRVADYLASIEHPINVIQSPIVDVIATENNDNKNPEPIVSDYANNKIPLNENPIVVDTHNDDTQPAGTAQNLSYYNPTQNQKRNNDKDVQQLHFNNEHINNNKESFININNNKDSSLFQTLNSGFSDEQLRTILQSQTSSGDLPVFNENYTNHFIENDFSQSAISQTQNKNNTNIYNGYQNQFLFTQPPMDYNNWTPTLGTLSTSMVPPPLGEPTWNAELGNRHITSTTKKPRQVQIIIPYISNSPTNLYQKGKENIRGSKEHLINPADIAVASSSSPLALYTQPPAIEESVWSHYVTKEVSSKDTPSTEKSKTISSIRDILLKEEQVNKNFNKPPFDIIRLQKNIDDWTEQEFSNDLLNIQKASTSAKLVPSKKIPSEYLTTQPYDKTATQITTVRSVQDELYDHEPAGSHTKISKVENTRDIDTNIIFTETTNFSTLTSIDSFTTLPATITTSKGKPLLNSATTVVNPSTVRVTAADTLQITPSIENSVPVVTPNPMWEKLPVSFSSLTKEKVYVVTPQPWKIAPIEINEKLLPFTESAIPTSPKFSVVIQPEGNKRIKESQDDVNGLLHIVYSEWPHLINNLQTTTTTEKPKTTNHPLFGLMDLSSYTPPPNSTVETYGGHSRVITVVTPTSVTKKITGLSEKKSTTKTISAGSTKKVS